MSNSTLTAAIEKRAITVDQVPEILIFIVSCLGNLVVIFAIIKDRRLKTSFNYLVLNLSLSNIFLVTFSIPFSLALHVTDYDFTFGKVGCKLLFPLATWALNVTVMSLLIITFERYIAIVHPFWWRSSQKHTLKIILGNYLYGIITVIPYIVTLKLTPSARGGHDCVETWGNTSQQVYTILLFLLQYGIPLPVMMVLYTRAWVHLKRRNDRAIRISEEARHARSMSVTPECIGNHHRPSVLSVTSTYSDEFKNMFLSFCLRLCRKSQGKRARTDSLIDDPDFFITNERRRQTIRTFLMFLLIVVIFAICSLPNQITWLLIIFAQQNLSPTAQTIFSILHYTNSVVNPFIYGGLNKYFWRAYKRILFSCLHVDDMTTTLTGVTVESPQPGHRMPDLFKEGIITRTPVVYINAGSIDSIFEEVKDEALIDVDSTAEPNMSKKRVKFKLSVSSINRKISIGSNGQERRHRKISAALVKDRQRKLTLPVLAASNIEPKEKERIRKTSVPLKANASQFVFDDSFSILPPAKRGSSLLEKLNSLTTLTTKQGPKRKIGQSFTPMSDIPSEFFLQVPERRNSKTISPYSICESEENELDGESVSKDKCAENIDCDETSNSTGETSVLSDFSYTCNDNHETQRNHDDYETFTIHEDHETDSDSKIDRKKLSNKSVKNDSHNSELDRIIEEMESMEESTCLDSTTDAHDKFFELLSQLETHSLLQQQIDRNNNSDRIAGVFNRSNSKTERFSRHRFERNEPRSQSCRVDPKRFDNLRESII